MRTHRTTLQVDDEFLFRGLTGQVATPPRTGVVTRVDEEGMINLEVHWPGGQMTHVKVGLLTFEAMVAQGIWNPTEKTLARS